MLAAAMAGLALVLLFAGISSKGAVRAVIIVLMCLLGLVCFAFAIAGVDPGLS